MNKLTEYRLKARLSMSELAKRAKVDNRTVSRAEDGLAIRDVQAAAIADALSEALNLDLTIQDLEIIIHR